MLNDLAGCSQTRHSLVSKLGFISLGCLPCHACASQGFRLLPELRDMCVSVSMQVMGSPLANYKVYGKPNPEPYELAEELLAKQAGLQRESTFGTIVAIGDNPNSDIAGANAAGAAACKRVAKRACSCMSEHIIGSNRQGCRFCSVHCGSRALPVRLD